MRSFLTAVLLSAFILPGFTQEPRSMQVSAEALFNRGLNALQGSGAGRSNLSALADIRSAAEAGFVPAQTALGFFYENGIIVTRVPAEAVRWYRKAAETGDRLGEYALGRSYFLGTGLQGDKSQAQEWLRRAADKGDPFAWYLLGRVLDERDYTAAPAAYRQAAEQGIPLAQYRLGLILRDGRGTKIERSEAYVWLLLSYDAGVQQAADPLRELEGTLGSNGTEAAKSRARELMNTVARSVNAHGCEGWTGELDEVPTIPPPELQKLCR